jgi:Lrp/AsnC family leucine-responsive transcriptional regulator
MDEKKTTLDSTDWKILAELQKDARLPFQKIGESVGMTRPAVRERITRMEEAGIISGYHAEINVDRLGRNVHALISFKFDSDTRYAEKPNDVLMPLLDSTQEVIRYWEIYGDLDFLIEAAFATKDRLHGFLDDLRNYGFVRSHLIASFARRLQQDE